MSDEKKLQLRKKSRPNDKKLSEKVLDFLDRRFNCRKAWLGLLTKQSEGKKKRCKFWEKLKKALTKKRCLINKKNPKFQMWFSLLEILIVIVIIGVLVAIGLRTYRSSQISSRDGKRKSELGQLANALELYHSDWGSYPDSNESGRIVVSSRVFAWGEAFYDPANTSTIYMSRLPEPAAGYSTFYESVDGGRGYRIYSFLENPRDGDVLGYYHDTDCGGINCNYVITSPNVPNPEPQPNPEATPAPTPEPEPEPTATPTPQPDPTATPTPQPEPDPTATPTPEPDPTATPRPIEATVTPTPTPADILAPSPTPSTCHCLGDSREVHCLGGTVYCHQNPDGTCHWECDDGSVDM